MPLSEIEIITDGARRRRAAAERLRIVEETLDDRASIPVIARCNGVAPNLLHRWPRLMLEEGGAPCPRMMMSSATRSSGNWRTGFANSNAKSRARRSKPDANDP